MTAANPSAVTTPSVSVIIPARNAARTLGACLDALARQGVPGPVDLMGPGGAGGPGGPAHELIVVDDGSTDDTARIARRPNVRVLTLDGRGPAAARNAGARAARGEILVYLDADTEPLDGWLREILAPLEDPAIVAVKGRYHTRQRGLLARFTQLEFEWKYARLQRAGRIDYVDTGTAAYRRDALLAAGAFDEALHTSEDVDLAFRLSEGGARFAFAPSAGVYHEHTDALLPYIRKKARGAYTRTRVYRRHPQKALGDSYTPPAMGLQIGLAALIMLAALSCVTRSRASIWSLMASLGAFSITTGPLLRVSLQHDPAIILFVPILIFVRGLAQGLGIGTALLAVVRSGGRAAKSKHVTH